MAFYTDFETGNNLLPVVKRVTLPTLISGMDADEIYQFWRTETESTTVGNTFMYPTDDTTKANNQATISRYHGDVPQGIRLYPDDTSQRSGRVSWSGRFCFNTFLSHIYTDVGFIGGDLQVDLTNFGGGANFQNFYTAKNNYPSLSICLGRRNQQFYFLDAVDGTDGYYRSLGNYAVFRFKLGLNTTDVTPIATVVIKVRGYGSTNAAAPPIADNTTSGVEMYVELGELDNIELFVFGFNSAETIVQNDIIAPKFADVLSVTKNAGNYFSFTEDLQTTTTISGTVIDGPNNPIERNIYLYDSDTNRLAGSTRSSVDGSFSFDVQPGRKFFAVCRDEGVTPRNILAFDNLEGV